MNDKVYLVVYSDYDTFMDIRHCYNQAKSRNDAGHTEQKRHPQALTNSRHSGKKNSNSLDTWFGPDDPRSKGKYGRYCSKLMPCVAAGSESAGCYIWLEHYYLVARQGDEVYLHFYKFNDWDEANRLAKIVRSTKSFSPENKTGIWTQYADSKPFGPKRKNMTSAVGASGFKRLMID
jgi:hypothetical protein